MTRFNQYKGGLPKEAIISITERCNSRCSFCNIWQTEEPRDLEVELIDKMPTSLRAVSITGGEPLLHKNFELLIRKFIDRDCRIFINTNGLVDLKKYEGLWKFKKIGLRFSLDGLKEGHDSLRGVPGNYDKVIKQIEYLKSIEFNNIGISSTFSEKNCHQAVELYNLSRRIEVDFTCMAVHNSGIYYKKKDNDFRNKDTFRDNLSQIIKKELRTLDPKRWRKVVYMDELSEFMSGRIKSLKCPAGQTNFFILPSGDMYACNMRNLLMGNLNKNSFEEIWFSSQSDKIRELTSNCVKPCWTMCNAKSIVKSDMFKFSKKFCRNFLKNFIGKNYG